MEIKSSELKKSKIISMMHDDIASDELRFLMLRDEFQGYEQALEREKSAEQDKSVIEEVCKRG